MEENTQILRWAERGLLLLFGWMVVLPVVWSITFGVVVGAAVMKMPRSAISEWVESWQQGDLWNEEI